MHQHGDIQASGGLEDRVELGVVYRYAPTFTVGMGVLLPEEYDYHLKPFAIAVDTGITTPRGGPLSVLGTDIDGEPRSVADPDIGADEVTP